jgi:hypothetical protein
LTAKLILIVPTKTYEYFREDLSRLGVAIVPVLEEALPSELRRPSPGKTLSLVYLLLPLLRHPVVQYFKPRSRDHNRLAAFVDNPEILGEKTHDNVNLVLADRRQAPAVGKWFMNVDSRLN